jgi:hypothetical protein
MINVYGARILPPTQMVNKDFVCGEAVRSVRRRYSSGRVRVEACQNPNRLVEWIRVSSASARFQAPDKAIEAENKRNSMMFGNGGFDVTDLSFSDDNEPRPNDSLVVHVLDTDNRAKDVPLLRVRPLNKRHKGETWYIQSSSINREANSSDYAH